MLELLYPIAFIQSATQSAAQEPSLPPPSPNCDSEEHAGFNFWVGEWDVYPNGKDTPVGQSRIERVHQGCAVVENWMPRSGASGTSLNHYDVQTGQWHQKWVGSAPGAVEFRGGVVEGKMVLSGYWADYGGPGRDALVRMTFSSQEGGAVRQFGEVSGDHGLTWQTSFDLLYRPKQTAQNRDNP